MAAVREGERRLALFLAVERLAGLFRAVRRFEQSDLAVGADHLEAAVAELNIGFRRLQKV